MAVDRPSWTIGAIKTPDLGDQLIAFADRQAKDKADRELKARQDLLFQQAQDDRLRAENERKADAEFLTMSRTMPGIQAGGITDNYENLTIAEKNKYDFTPEELAATNKVGFDKDGNIINRDILKGTTVNADTLEAKMKAQMQLGQDLVTYAPRELRLNQLQRIADEVSSKYGVSPTKNMMTPIEQAFTAQLNEQKATKDSADKSVLDYRDKIIKTETQMAKLRDEAAKDSTTSKGYKPATKMDLDTSLDKLGVTFGVFKNIPGSDVSTGRKAVEDTISVLSGGDPKKADLIRGVAIKELENARETKLFGNNFGELGTKEGVAKFAQAVKSKMGNTTGLGEEYANLEANYNSYKAALAAAEAKSANAYNDPYQVRQDEATAKYRELLNTPIPGVKRGITKVEGKTTTTTNGNTGNYGDYKTVKKVASGNSIEGVPDSLVYNEGGALTQTEKDIDSQGKVVGKVIANGYNYTIQRKNPELMRKEFKAAGIDDATIKAALNNEDISISQEQANKLSKIIYDREGVDKAKRLIKNYDSLDPMVKEIANDFAYRGDLTGELKNVVASGDINKIHQYVTTNPTVANETKTRLANILTMERVPTTVSKEEVLGDSVSSDNKDSSKEKVLEEYAAKKEEANSEVDPYGRTIWFKNTDVNDGRYGKIYTDTMDSKGGSKSKAIARLSTTLRKDGFNSIDEITKLYATMPEGKDKDAVYSVLDYKLMQSSPEYRDQKKREQYIDAALTALSAVPLPAGLLGRFGTTIGRSIFTKPLHTVPFPKGSGYAGIEGGKFMARDAAELAKKTVLDAERKAGLQSQLDSVSAQIRQLLGKDGRPPNVNTQKWLDYQNLERIWKATSEELKRFK